MKKNKALMRGFLNLYDKNYEEDQIVLTEDEEFIVYRDFSINKYPEFKFNLLISSKENPTLDLNLINKFKPFISISKNRPIIPPKAKIPFFLATTFYDPSFVELYSFKKGKKATWKNIDKKYLINDDDIENQYGLEKLISEERRTINFQNNIESNLGKVEKLIQKLYQPKPGEPGILIKPFLKDKKFYSQIRSPLYSIIKNVYEISIKNNVSDSQLSSDVLTNFEIEYNFTLDPFNYEKLVEEGNKFHFSQSCLNFYNQLIKLNELSIDQNRYNSLKNRIEIATNLERIQDSKKEIVEQYFKLFRYLGIVQDDYEGNMYFVPADPTEFINKLISYFDIIKTEVRKFKERFNYLNPLLNDSFLSDSDIKKIDKLLQIFRTKTSQVNPNLENILDDIKDFYFPLLLFSLFIGFCGGRKYFINRIELEGSFQNKMEILTTPIALVGGSISEEKTIEENLEIIYEMVKLDGKKEIKKRGFNLNYIQIISINQKHQILKSYGEYISQKLESLKNKLEKFIRKIEESEFFSKFLKQEYLGDKERLDDLKPKLASKNNLSPSLNEIDEIEERTESYFQEWETLNNSYIDLRERMSDFKKKGFLAREKEYQGCTTFEDNYNKFKNKMDRNENKFDQIKERLETISTYDLNKYEQSIVEVNSDLDDMIVKYEELESKLDKYFNQTLNELKLKRKILLRAAYNSDRSIRNDNVKNLNFLDFEWKTCGEFLNTINEKKEKIKAEGDYLTSGCWKFYLGLMEKYDIDEVNNYSKKIDLGAELSFDDQECLKKLIDSNIIDKETIIIYKI